MVDYNSSLDDVWDEFLCYFFVWIRISRISGFTGCYPTFRWFRDLILLGSLDDEIVWIRMSRI